MDSRLDLDELAMAISRNTSQPTDEEIKRVDARSLPFRSVFEPSACGSVET